MARRYTYSRTITTVEGIEEFTAHEWDSFDEARTGVEKGIRDREIQLSQKYPGTTNFGMNLSKGPATPTVPAGQVIPPTPGTPTNTPPKDAATENAAGPSVPSGNNTTGGDKPPTNR